MTACYRRSMRIALVLAVVLSVSGWVSSPPASAQQTSRTTSERGVDARVRALLSGIETAPTREELLALGPEGLEALIRLHADTQALGALRLRAITCAGWFDGPRAHAFLVELSRAPGQEPLHLRAALRALAAREGTQAVDELVRHAQHADVAVREAVLVSLATLATMESVSAADRRAVRSTLEDLLGRETDQELVTSVRARLR